MNARAREFYRDVDEVLKAVDVKSGEFFHSGGRATCSDETNYEMTGRESACALQVYPEPLAKPDLLRERKMALKAALSSKDITELENAVEWAKFHGFEAELRNEIYQAKLSIKHLLDLDRIRNEIRDLRQSVISELRSYKRPPETVHTIMICAYLLLGIGEESHLRQWKTIRSLMSMTGRNSLKTRMVRLAGLDVDPDVAVRVKELLSSYDENLICNVSEGASVIYVWIRSILSEFEANKKEEEERYHILGSKE